jgi:hypothetical protein
VTLHNTRVNTCLLTVATTCPPRIYVVRRDPRQKPLAYLGELVTRHVQEDQALAQQNKCVAVHQVDVSPVGIESVLGASKLSHNSDRQQAESTKTVESRIVYHRHLPDGRPGTLAFAESPDFTPKVYTDEVAENLLGVAKKTTQLAKAHSKNSKDEAVMPTAGPLKPLSPPGLGGKRIGPSQAGVGKPTAASSDGCSGNTG